MTSPRDTLRGLWRVAKRVMVWHSPTQWLVRVGAVGAAFLVVRQVIREWVSPWAWDAVQGWLPGDPSWLDYAAVGVLSVLLASSPMGIVPIFAIAVVAPPRDPVIMLGSLHKATIRRDQARLRLDAAVDISETVLACDETGAMILDEYAPSSQNACRDHNRRMMRRAMMELRTAKAGLERAHRQLARAERRADRRRQRHLARLARTGILQS